VSRSLDGCFSFEQNGKPEEEYSVETAHSDVDILLLLLLLLFINILVFSI
jgi:hypothetical protein